MCPQSGIGEGMGRELKPQKIKEVRHKTLPITIDIMLDRNKLIFFFVYGENKVEAGTADEALALAKAKLNAFQGVEWEAVIEIDHDTHDGNSWRYGEERYNRDNRAGLRLEFSRYERGRFDGKWQVQRKHILDCDAYDLKKRALNDADGKNYVAHSNDLVVPYSEETWRALHEMISAVHRINDQLTALWQGTPDDINARLGRLTTRLALPAVRKSKKPAA